MFNSVSLSFLPGNEGTKCQAVAKTWQQIAKVGPETRKGWPLPIFCPWRTAHACRLLRYLWPWAWRCAWSPPWWWSDTRTCPRVWPARRWCAGSIPHFRVFLAGPRRSWSPGRTRTRRWWWGGPGWTSSTPPVRTKSGAHFTSQKISQVCVCGRGE